MQCEAVYWGICFVVPTGGEQSIFKFADFIAALALLVIVYTMTDVRYRFRLSIAPTVFHLYVETFALIGVIGFGTLLTDLWATERWLFPDSLISSTIWRFILAAMFLSLAMTWMWYAFIRPPIFGKRNYRHFANSLYYSVIRGSNEDFPVLAVELSRSAVSLIRLARQDAPRWASDTSNHAQTSKQKRRKPNAHDIAHDVLLLLGNRKLCRHIVESSSVTAIAIFDAAAAEEKPGLPLGQFSTNISTEAIRNKDSILYHEDEGFNSGLTGYLKTFSRAVYGNYPLVARLGDRFGSPLDIDLQLLFTWDADQVRAYSRALQLTLEDYLRIGQWQPSPVINRAMRNVSDHATRDLYTLDKSDGSALSSDVAKRLHEAVRCLTAAVDAMDKHPPIQHFQLRVRDKYVSDTLYDTIANAMFEIVLDASSVTSPFFTSWQIQYVDVWSQVFDRSSGKAWSIVQFKLRRLLYNEILMMDKFPNFKSAKILGICLNVMGMTPHEGGSFARSYRALHRVVLAWTKRNFLKVRRAYPDVAEAALMGGVTFDRRKMRLVKTYAKGLSRRPSRTYLELGSPGQSTMIENPSNE